MHCAHTLDVQVEALSSRLQQAHTSLERQRVSSETEVQNARIELTRVTAAAREAEVSLRALSALNLVTLYRVLGGGWSPEPTNP